jgi:hypothetical protein
MEVGLDVILKHFGNWVLERYQVKDVKVSEKELAIWNEIFSSYLINDLNGVETVTTDNGVQSRNSNTVYTNVSNDPTLESESNGMVETNMGEMEIQTTGGSVQETTYEETTEIIG